ncbi:acyltransferase [Stenotrophomonas maltophilia]|uniref:acyltransferase family protein n=1 Tax=Stenotrophomonas pavanii TaxID=487698 RepID=UPI00231CE0A3|nr:acyltransferase [Stenotrophomonas maltophilia]
MQDNTAVVSAVTALPKRGRLEFLDALRGLAAAYVVIYHMTLMPQPQLALPRWAEKFTLMGGTGVTLFFIVSAFSLYYTMPMREGSPKPTASFYLHRFFRVAPLFYFLILVSWLRDAWLFDVHHSVSAVAASATFIFNLFPMRQEGFVWAGWTIGVEMIFYAVFPLIYARVRDRYKAVAFIFVTLLFWYFIGLVLDYLVLPEGWRESILQWSTFKHFPIFATGILLYYWFMDTDADCSMARSKGQAALFAGAFTYFALVQGWMPNILGNPYYFQALAYGLIFVGLALFPWKLVVNRFTSFLGKVSYSVYLLHPTIVYLLIPVYRRVHEQQSDLTVAFIACAGLTFVILLPLAWLSYRLIELPGIRLGRRLENRWLPKRVSE